MDVPARVGAPMYEHVQVTASVLIQCFPSFTLRPVSPLNSGLTGSSSLATHLAPGNLSLPPCPHGLSLLAGFPSHLNSSPHSCVANVSPDESAPQALFSHIAILQYMLLI